MKIYEKTIEDSLELLKENESDWIKKWQAYAEEIIEKQEQAITNKEQFNQWKPLTYYTNVSIAKKNPNIFSVRFLGTEVASIKTKDNNPPLLIINEQKTFKHAPFVNY